jgi:hypothetical protein
MLAWSATGAICGFLVYVVVTSEPTALRNPAAAVGVLGLLASTLQARRSKIEFMRAYSGVEAERVVAVALKRAGVTAIVNGAVLEGGDADHVVFGPAFAVVETKHGRGPVRVDNGRFKVGAKTLPRDPIGQVLRQVDVVTRFVGRRPVPIVCVPGMTTAPFETRGVLVCSSADIGKVLRGLPQIYDPTQAVAVAKRLHESSDRAQRT